MKEKCPVCGSHARLLPIYSGKSDGFKIGMLCQRCVHRFTSSAGRLRALASVIVHSLMLNPEGGTFSIGGNAFKLTQDFDRQAEADLRMQNYLDKKPPDTRTDEEKEADRLKRRQQELERLCPPEVDLTCWQEEKSWRNPLVEDRRRM